MSIVFGPLVGVSNGICTFLPVSSSIIVTVDMNIPYVVPTEEPPVSLRLMSHLTIDLTYDLSTCATILQQDSNIPYYLMLYRFIAVVLNNVILRIKPHGLA